jgi:hypothetical protein
MSSVSLRGKAELVAHQYLLLETVHERVRRPDCAPVTPEKGAYVACTR